MFVVVFGSPSSIAAVSAFPGRRCVPAASKAPLASPSRQFVAVFHRPSPPSPVQ